MKYKLRQLNGDWSFDVEGEVVFADHLDGVNISHLHVYTDSVRLALTDIPYRIDVTSAGDIWLHGKIASELLKEPYKSPGVSESKTVFVRES